MNNTPSRSPLRVLHLEDSSRDRELVAEALAPAGLDCQFTDAQTQKEFEAALARGELGCFKEVAANLTAGTTPGLGARVDLPREVGLIAKPYEPEDLLAAVAQALPAPPAPPDTPKPPATITGRHKILIVEDDRKISLALATRLRAAGQEVSMAYDALQGLDVALKNLPDLVLIDIGLPCGSGLVVAERIQQVVPKFTPIIFLTASRRPGLRDQAMALGAAGFPEKPYEANALLAAIQQALNPPSDPAFAPSL